MTNRENNRSLPEHWKNFDPSAFFPGDQIAFYNPNTNRWDKGRLAAPPPNVPVIDRANRRIFIESMVGPVELTIPPKKVDGAILRQNIKIRNEDRPGVHTQVDYRVSLDGAGEPQWRVTPNGDIEVTLEPVTPGANHKEINNVNIDTLKNVQEIEQVENAADAQLNVLRNTINGIDNIRRKDLLKKVNELDQEVRKLVDQAGHFDEMGDIEKHEIKAASEQIKELRRKVEDGVREIGKALRKIQAEIGATTEDWAARKKVVVSLESRVDRVQTDVDKKWADFDKDQQIKKEHDKFNVKKAAWDIKKTAYDAWVAAGKPKPALKDLEPEPEEPSTEDGLPRPTESKNKALNAALELEKINITASSGGPEFQVHRDMIAEINKRFGDKKTAEGMSTTESFPSDDPSDPDKGDKIVLGELFLKLLEEWKGKEVSPEASKFDFDAEQTEVIANIKELLKKADDFSIGNNSMNTIADSLRNILNTVDGYDKKTVVSGKKVDVLLADAWRDVADLEVELFKEEVRTGDRAEKKKEIDVDLPPHVLQEILRSRPNEMRDVMRSVYDSILNGSTDLIDVGETLKKLFEPSPTQMNPRNTGGNLQPNDAMIEMLRNYGIKDWRHFKKLWDENLAPKAAELMKEWADDDITKQAARNTAWWEKMWANKGPVAAKMATSIVLIGGSGLLFSTLPIAAVVGATAATLAGLGLGANLRAGLQKLVFGKKWFKDLEENNQKQLTAEKQRDAVNGLMSSRFGDNFATAPVFDPEGLRDLSNLLSQVTREVSGDFVAKDTIAESQGLDANDRRIYLQAIQDAESHGDVLDETIKLKFAVAIKKLRQGGAKTAAEVAGNNSVVMKLAGDFMSILGGTQAKSEDYGTKQYLATVGVGMAVGSAFLANSKLTRGILGGVGGVVLGGKAAESWRESREYATARRTLDNLNDRSLLSLNSIMADRDSRRPIDRDNLREHLSDVQMLNRLLQGKGDSVADLNIARLLASDKTLRARVENVVYQTYRHGLFAEMAIGKVDMGALQRQADETARESNIRNGDKAWNWIKRNGVRTIGMTVGAAAMAGVAIATGEGIAYGMKQLGFGHHDVGEEVRKATNLAKVEASAPAVAVGVDHAAHNNDLRFVDDLDSSSPDHTTATVEIVHHRPAGLIEAPTKVTGIDDWRHQIMEKMGYKFHGGKIDHALRFHPGAKIALMHHDGTPVVDAKGHAVEYTFKKGGSTSDALEHLQRKAGALIKANDVPTLKIEGADTGKVEVLDHYRVESHVGGKAHMETGEQVGKMETPQVRDVGPSEFKQGAWSEQYTDAKGHAVDDNHSAYFGRSGKSYTPIFSEDAIGDESLFAFKDEHGNLFGFRTGEYIGTINHGHAHEVPAVLAKQNLTNWSSGGAVSNRSELESMLKGTTPGGPAAEAAPQAGVRGGATTEVVKPLDANAGEAVKPVDGKVATPVAEAKVGAPVAPEAKADLVDVPAAFKGHEVEYQALQNMEKNVVNDLNKVDVNLVGDKAGVMDHMLKRIDSIFSRSPKLLDNPLIKDALTSPGFSDSVRLMKILDVLGGANHLELSPAENVLLGGVNTDHVIVIKNVIHKGEIVDAMVAKDGSHAVRYENVKTHAVEVVTNSKTIFNSDRFESKGDTGTGIGKAVLDNPNSKGFKSSGTTKTLQPMK